MLQRVLVGAIVLAIGLVGVVASPVTAAPVCSKVTAYNSPNGQVWVLASSSGSVDCGTRRGNVSDAIVQLQHTMNECYATQVRNAGEYPLSTDGDFGGGTEAALKAVQRFIGTTADGKYGPNTRNAMKFIHTEAFPLSCRRFR